MGHKNGKNCPRWGRFSLSMPQVRQPPREFQVAIRARQISRRMEISFMPARTARLNANCSSSDFLIRMRISSQIWEIDLALYFGKIGKPHRENFHFSWERVPFTISC